MRETLVKLVALQAIDDEARGFLKERADLTHKIERLKVLLEKGQEGLDEKKSKLADAKRWYDEKQTELDADKAKVDKAKVKLQAVTKNKEYMAMQKEIESLRTGIQSREDEVLKLLEAMDDFKKSVTAEQSKLRTLKAEVASEEKNSAARLKELTSEIDTISARKGGVSEGVKRPLLARYDRIYGARDGIVMAPVYAKACGVCHFAIPAQQLNRVLVGDTLEVCRNCSRMLYMAPSDNSETDDAES